MSRYSVVTGISLVFAFARSPVVIAASGMDGDAEAQALLAAFRSTQVSHVHLQDTFDKGARAKKIVGPVTPCDGRELRKQKIDRALSFAVTEETEVYALYSLYVPVRGRASLDFRIKKIPHGYRRMTLFSVGTPGNTELVLRVMWPTADGPILIGSTITKRETVRLTSDPIELGPWHRVEWWYDPEGSVLLLDGVIHDFSTDWCVPWAAGRSSVLYLGDQPWWSRGKPVFYRGDGFAGELDNLKVVGIEHSRKETHR